MRTPLPRNPPTGLRRLRRHVVQRRRWVALLLACAVVEAFAQSGSWLLVRVAINEGIVPRDEHVLALATAAYVWSRVTGWALFGFVIRGMARFGQELVLGLRRELFDHLTSLSLRYFSEQRAGWIIARLTSDVDAISDVLSQGLPTLVTNSVLLPAAVTALFINDWRLALVALVVLPPALVLTRWFQRRRPPRSSRSATGSPASPRTSPSRWRAWRSCSRSGASAPSDARFDELNVANREANVVAQRISSLFFPSIEFLGVVATVAVLAVGAGVLPTSEIGTLAAAYFLLGLVFQPLQELSDLYSQLQSATAAMIKVSAVLDTEADVRSPAHPRDPGRCAARSSSTACTSPTAQRACCTASTCRSRRAAAPRSSASPAAASRRMAKLVARFYDPPSGSVRADGIDLRELDLHAYRRQLGVVLQDPFLFSGTIADNIRFARPDATDARWPRPPPCSASTGSRAASPRASTTRCARAAAGCRPASAS